ncbi:tungsten-dependent benzoyl-CoA reductase-related protein bamD [Desulforamulus reducens MI-1]|uniref:Tungsten-dependent benzoyl-CoA reductase-related protein bamD n=1 Tax=Desulforamulus reducens (strain ATCC BAA-1160 / DSM 100696 / MI-1) TaxID=349161 RepID=A4J5F5_DESRM|nr:(Fe-S)-binding protein [Desulforamulus reducens]ABO50308.1 tungsten-dependent benzoyl-CoA reductase-related protein bamD [Desulforamulus reducens MI-1]
MSEAATYFLEVRDAIVEMGGENINLCMQCGTCAGTCPWGRLEEKSPFNIRKMIYQGRMGLEGYETDDILYACTTCGHCVTRCPRGVKITDVVRAMRSVIGETGGIPKNLKAAVGSINSQGNPWSQPREKRDTWAKDLDINKFTPETEYLLFVCCTSAFDGRSQKIARSIAELLKKAGVSFGIIGNQEQCCGESIRKIGAESEFSMLAESNIKLFKENGVKKIITTSPHCLSAFKNDYPEFGGEFEVFHYTQILDDLVKEGKLSFTNAKNQKVIYHEPCYLGRHSQIFEAPRELLSQVPGVETIEFAKSQKDSLCCGGGGARIWMETESGQRFSDFKVQEASDKEADILVTACPYCVVMMEDSAKTLNKDEEIKIMDISEILKENLG